MTLLITIDLNNAAFAGGDLQELGDVLARVPAWLPRVVEGEVGPVRLYDKCGAQVGEVEIFE